MEVPGYTNCKWTSLASPCSSGGVEKLLLHSEKDRLLLWLTEVAVVSGESSHSPESEVQVGKVDLSCVNGIHSIACNGEKVWATDGKIDDSLKWICKQREFLNIETEIYA